MEPGFRSKRSENGVAVDIVLGGSRVASAGGGPQRDPRVSDTYEEDEAQGGWHGGPWHEREVVSSQGSCRQERTLHTDLKRRSRHPGLLGDHRFKVNKRKTHVPVLQPSLSKTVTVRRVPEARPREQ